MCRSQVAGMVPAQSRYKVRRNVPTEVNEKLDAGVSPCGKHACTIFDTDVVVVVVLGEANGSTSVGSNAVYQCCALSACVYGVDHVPRRNRKPTESLQS